MLYMVIEKFKTPGGVEIYRRFANQGRMMPDGLEYVSSWVDMDFTRCYQLMKTDHQDLFRQWTRHWEDLMEFQILPVRTSAEAVEVIGPLL